MTPEEIKTALETNITEAQIEVSSDGSHVHLVVISPAFEGLNAVKKQQLVYGALQDAIANGAIHAVHMKTYTPAEWAAQSA
ncbi:MAG: BolA/IbaG family iron-sulfur metabolism protein [Agarilytica sp.]